MARKKVETSAHKTAKTGKHSRKDESVRQLRPDVIIACEDIASSPEYFRQIVQQLRADRQVTPDSLVIARHTNTHPTGVLADLQAHKTTQGKTYRQFTHKWIVIDRDVEMGQGNGHAEQDFNDALVHSRKAGVNVAYANDCFELWYLLHFEAVTSEMLRTEVMPRVIAHLKRFDARLFAALDNQNIKGVEMTKRIFDALLPKQNEAIVRAQRLLESYDGHNPAKDNPSTTVHYLVCLLRSLNHEQSSSIDDICIT